MIITVISQVSGPGQCTARPSTSFSKSPGRGQRAKGKGQSQGATRPATATLSGQWAAHPVPPQPHGSVFARKEAVNEHTGEGVFRRKRRYMNGPPGAQRLRPPDGAAYVVQHRGPQHVLPVHVGPGLPDGGDAHGPVDVADGAVGMETRLPLRAEDGVGGGDTGQAVLSGSLLWGEGPDQRVTIITNLPPRGLWVSVEKPGPPASAPSAGRKMCIVGILITTAFEKVPPPPRKENRERSSEKHSKILMVASL